MGEVSLDKLMIGFEIHAQIATQQKLYCDCPTDYQEAEPNTNTCSVCTGLPGNKPMPVNKDALYTAIEVALMLNSEIITDEEIYVQRKHYDYPDLPNGYQKTSTPIARNGNFLGVGITEVHIEDDPGRYDLSKGKVDYNRCGVPLIEIVTDPDIKSPEHARQFWNDITDMLAYTGKIRLEPGTIRSDTNISMGSERVEVKNVNSATGIYHALQYEMKRQLKADRRGRDIIMETRGFLEDKMITAPLRVKETFADYRYIPDPDIPPIIITREMVDEIREYLVETPKQKEERFINEYKIHPEMASSLTSNPSLGNMFEYLSVNFDSKDVASWLTTEVKRNLNDMDIEAGYDIQNIISHRDIEDILKSVYQGKISTYQGKDILKKVMKDRELGKAEYYLKYKSMLDEDTLDEIIDGVIEENKPIIADYMVGKEKALNSLVGKVMKQTKGSADPKEVYNIIKQKITLK